MPETPIDGRPAEAAEDDPTVAADQRRRAYYYDDACGYEVYDPDADVDDDDAAEDEPANA